MRYNYKYDNHDKETHRLWEECDILAPDNGLKGYSLPGVWWLVKINLETKTVLILTHDGMFSENPMSMFYNISLGDRLQESPLDTMLVINEQESLKKKWGIK